MHEAPPVPYVCACACVKIICKVQTCRFQITIIITNTTLLNYTTVDGNIHASQQWPADAIKKIKNQIELKSKYKLVEINWEWEWELHRTK